jgi:hypothetical protein
MVQYEIGFYTGWICGEKGQMLVEIVARKNEFIPQGLNIIS